MTQPSRSAPLGFGRPGSGEELVWTRTNVVGITIAVLLLCFLLGTTYENYLRDQAAEQNGIELAEASQNARSGVELLTRELRAADAGGRGSADAWILIGSQYRITFACDLDGNRRLDLGEVITYFLDPNWRDAPISSKPNPYGFVLRRKVGARGDSLATPTLGEGEIVAYGLSQRSSDRVTTKDVPLFSYRDSLGVPLELGADAKGDPAGVFFGRTVPEEDLAGRPSGADRRMRSIRIRLVAETKERDRETGRYDRATVGSTVVLGGAAARGGVIP
jgi:hypothetical protein